MFPSRMLMCTRGDSRPRLSGGAKLRRLQKLSVALLTENEAAKIVAQPLDLFRVLFPNKPRTAAREIPRLAGESARLRDDRHAVHLLGDLQRKRHAAAELRSARQPGAAVATCSLVVSVFDNSGAQPDSPFDSAQGRLGRLPPRVRDAAVKTEILRSSLGFARDFGSGLIRPLSASTSAREEKRGL